MDRKRVLLIILAPVLLLVLTVGYMHAQGPDLQAEPRGIRPNAPTGTGFTYQGQLKDAGGSPIDDTCDFTFSLWDAESAGSQVGADSVVSGVAVTNGYFAALVNSGSEFGAGAFAGEERWLEIAVQCAADPSPITLSPRQLLSAAPYAEYSLGAPWSGLTGVPNLQLRVSGTCASGNAIRVVNADGSVTCEPVGGVGPHDHWGESWSGSGTGLTLSGGDVGLSGSGTSYGLYGESSSTIGTGVVGSATASSGSASGVYGLSASTDGRAVVGWAPAASGVTYGVYGRSDSTDGRGVVGWATADSGTTNGVRGVSDSTRGLGVYGYARATSGSAHGVYGLTDSASGCGVYGYASSTSSSGYGVCGVSGSTDGRGVYGRGIYGVHGVGTSSTGGRGVYGYASATSGSTYGVYGESNSPTGYGVYGRATATNANYGVYSWGNTGATGTKSAIVPTQDYGWRHLYSMESPDVLFEDVGTAELVDGQAVVAIDPIFAQTVNLEQPYQVFLTPVSDEPVLLFVTAKSAASFTVQAVTLDGQPADCSFDYRLIAKRLGYEDIRLAPAADPTLNGEVPEREVAP